jgi:hypothetical protein
LNGLDDVLIAGAASEIAGNAEADFVLRGAGVLLQEPPRAHDHPRRAEPALQPVFLPEGRLYRMQFAICSQTFDRGDTAAVSLQLLTPR